MTLVSQLSLGICGLIDGSSAGDWRLPNIRELLSLVDYGQSAPALPSGHPFLNVTPTGVYWSSSSFVGAPNFAWSVSLATGGDTSGNKLGFIGVWPVRGGE